MGVIASYALGISGSCGFWNLFEPEVDVCLLLVGDKRCLMSEIELIISSGTKSLAKPAFNVRIPA
jgi:hypothetical protein